MNIVPDTVCDTGNYFCTWRTQNTVLKNKKLTNLNLEQTRDSLCENFLFGNPGILNLIDEDIRKDLIIVLDDGWDVPYGLKPSPKDGGNEDYRKFGSMILNENRFPSFKGNPEERLKKLSDKIKEMGYKGLGLWLAVQVSEDEEDTPEIWEEKFTMLNYADIKYVKLDWGKYCHDVRYREMLTLIAKMKSPEVKMEHSCPRPSFNYTDDKKYRDEITALMSVSDYLRLYDVSAEFRHTTMIERCREALEYSNNSPNPYTIPNIEDPVYIGAALGFGIGAMRMFPLENDQKYSYSSQLKTPMSALKRALMWQRMAPPFALNMSDFEISDKTNTDVYTYPVIEGNPWPYMSGKEVTQTAPRIISRNMPLPKIKSKDGVFPYVLSSIHPVTNAVSIFFAPRTINQDIFYTPLCNAEITVSENTAPIGIFGKFDTLKITFPKTIRNKKIYIQDLASNEATDITDDIEITGKSIILKGLLAEKICNKTKECDEELPGIMIKLK